MDPLVVVDDRRRRLSTFINGGYYAADVALRLSELEGRHTLYEQDSLARPRTYTLTTDADAIPIGQPTTSTTQDGNSSQDIQDRTYDRIRKCKLNFDGQTDPIDFIEWVEELARPQRIALDEVPFMLSESFKDSTLSWCRNRRHEWSGWATFRRAFLKYFLPTNFWEDLDDTIRRRLQREDEPFKEYALALETLMRHTQYDNLHKIDRIYKNKRNLRHSTNFRIWYDTLRSRVEASSNKNPLPQRKLWITCPSSLKPAPGQRIQVIRQKERSQGRQTTSIPDACRNRAQTLAKITNPKKA